MQWARATRCCSERREGFETPRGNRQWQCDGQLLELGPSTVFLFRPSATPSSRHSRHHDVLYTHNTMPLPQKISKNSTRPAKSLRLLRSLKVLIQAVKPRPFKLSARRASRNSHSNVATQAPSAIPPTHSRVSEEARSSFATFTSGVRAARRAQQSQEHQDETPVCEGDCVIPMKRKMVVLSSRTPAALPASSPVSPSLEPAQQDVGTTEEQPPTQTPEVTQVEVSFSYTRESFPLSLYSGSF